MIFADCETCGLHSPIVLLQWAEDDGPIHLHNVWKRPIQETLDLIIKFTENEIVGFNLSFDWFHICKLYTTLILFPESTRQYPPEYYIKEFAEFEVYGRDGPCLKPKGALDLMLHARTGPYQATMQRKPIRIKRIPSILAEPLVRELEKRIPLKDIYFAKKKDKTQRWQIRNTNDPEFKDIVIDFAPSSALKALAADALKVSEDEILLHSMVEVGVYPREYGFAPFAEGASKPLVKADEKKTVWPDIIKMHISHWEYNARARQYASDDVKYTRDLYKYFGSPPIGDDDSTLSCMVGAVRWKGFNVDLTGIRKLKEAAKQRLYNPLCPKCKELTFEPKDTSSQKSKRYICKECGFESDRNLIPTYSGDSKKFLEAVLSEDEKTVLDGGTGKVILEKFIKDKEHLWTDECKICKGEGCEKCGFKGQVKHPICVRAELIDKARKAQYEIALYNKLLIAGRFHASLAVIGTLSSRMGGGGAAKGVEHSGKAKGDQLNAQGIKRTKEVRSKFPLAFSPMVLCGGDFSSFELSLAEAVYNDPQMREDMTRDMECHKCKGKGCKNCENTGKVKQSLIGIFGTFCFPDKTYLDIVSSKGSKELDLYDPPKRGVYALLYGGNADTIQERVEGISKEGAEDAEKQFMQRYKVVKKHRDKTAEKFSALTQPDGIGRAIFFKKSEDYVESPLGFRRYFTFENQIREELFKLANNPPKEWKAIKIKVQRRDRQQFVSGAVQSALFAAAFTLQGVIIRAALNHEIQSFGAQITKHLQRKIWDMQPPGINEWIVCPLNIHDELMVPCHPNHTKQLEETVQGVIETFKPKVPLLEMEWKTGMESWASK